MPTQRFLDLDQAKRERIFEVCLREFAQYGYENGSTNRIIEESGISKGSLFKYFDSKEELYMYVLDVCAEEMTAQLGAAARELSGDMFDLAVEYSCLEFAWYAAHPLKARLIIDAFSRSDSEISRLVQEKYAGRDDEIYFKLMGGVDDSRFRYDRGKTVNIFKWFMTGFNSDFLDSLRYETGIDIDALKEKYVTALREHIAVLRAALLN